MKPTALLLVLLAGTLLLCAACHRGPEVRLLLDGNHAPDVLTEQRRIALPPSLGGNRFLTGWRPWLHQDRLALAPPAPGARVRLEVVHLGAGARGPRRPRTLLLDLVAAAPDRSVRVRIAGRDLGTFPLVDPVAVPLPADLPLGRVAVDLQFDGRPYSVLGAGIQPVLSAGKVTLTGADVLQSGDSLVDFVRHVAGGERLVGTFSPPRSPRPGQRFELLVEREPGRVRRFAWSAGAPAAEISLPVGEGPGLARIRLLAHGEGPAGRWGRLGIAGRRNAEPPAVVAAAPPVDPPGRPPRLVIVYVMDALRADMVRAGLAPTWDRLAREGVAFRRHRSVAPNTIPSTKALFTGRAAVTGGDASLSPDAGPTLAERFRAAGYRTALFSGNVYVSPSFGTDRGFEHVAADVLMDADAAGPEALNDNAARANAAALEWLRTLRQGERGFLYVHTIHPHNPYAPPDPYRTTFTRGIPSAIDGSTETLTAVRKGLIAAGPADRERLRGLYRASLAFNDAELGRFLRQVETLAPPGETLVILTSDHGEELFDHGGVLHGYTLYEELLDIPLVLWWPGRLAPRAVDEPSDTLDLHATLLDLCGLPGTAGDGRPLLRPGARRDRYVHLAAASSVVGGIYSAQAGRWKYVWAPRFANEWGMGDGSGRTHDPEYLFDLETDPAERINRAGDPGLEAGLEAAWLRSRLLAWIQKQGAREPPRRQQPVTAETERRLRALGYGNAK